MIPRLLLAAALCCAAVTPVSALELGEVSFYGGKHHGLKMANGQIFDQWSDICAHKKHPFGTRLRVTHMVSKKSVECVVRDRGPFIKGRIVDLSVRGASDLGIRVEGVAPVTVEVLR